MSHKKRIIVCTSNQWKLAQYKQVLGLLFNVVGVNDLYPDVKAPEENGYSYAENALIKLSHYRCSCFGHNRKSDIWMADDSGIELQESTWPGLHSARIAAKEGNYNYILCQLKRYPPLQRYAVEYVTVYAHTGVKLFHQHGDTYGDIVMKPRGSGFGYDNIFVPQGQRKTLGQMEPDAYALYNTRCYALREIISTMQETL